LAVNTNKTQEKSGVKLPVIIAAAVAMVILLGWLGHRAFAPSQAVETSASKTHDAFYAKVAHEAGPTGDLTKVNPEDRTRFENEFRGAPITPETALKQWIASHGSK